MRVKIIDPNGILSKNNDNPGIFVCWHNRIFLLPVLAPKHILKKCSILNSRSRDGQYMADYMTFLGMTSVRGSSSKSGAKALSELKKELDQGQHLLITPDGPRGPLYEPKHGVLWLSSRQQCPIIPVSINFKSYRALKSWDKMQIPMPFTKVELVIGNPIFIEPELGDQTIADEKEKLRVAMMDITSDRISA